MTDKAFLRIVVSFLVLHLVAAVGLLIMEATVKALEAKSGPVGSQPREEKRNSVQFARRHEFIDRFGGSFPPH